MNAPPCTEPQVRPLEAAEWRLAYPIVAQLRALDEAEFLRRVRLQASAGYALIGAFLDGALIGVLGMRPVHTLARGPHLHIDDLIVDAAARKSGIGRALMDYAEAEASARGMTAVYLDARREAIGFYECRNYVPNPAPLMKKAVGP